MNDHRKSGFLAPDFGTTNNGFEITTPYYINIAPNLDDTIIPREMSKRGLMIGNEFRYLEPGIAGKLALEYLDHDRLTGTNRYFGSLTQQAQLGNGFGLMINTQEASDNAYLRDLGSTVIPNANAAANPYLPRDFLLTKQYDLWSLQLHALSFQTLNDPNKPIGDQYRMRPQFVANYSNDVYGMDFDFNNEFTDFLHSNLASNIQGQRYVSNPSLKLPINLGYGFIAPKVSLHYTDYNLQSGTTSISQGTQNLSGQNVSRSVPITSLDTGLFFDRDLEWNDKPMMQTLEPRLYYVYIPYKDQSSLPLFNTGVADFSYSQLFSENQFSGPDRINEANQITAAVQSRLIDTKNGAELIRGLIGQRYYFEAQQTAISGQTVRSSNSSDILAGLSGRINKEMTSSFLWDYNPTLQRTEKFSLDGRYIPQPGQAINLSYRINRDTPGQADIRQIDASAELPLGRGWSGVARVNYDTAQSTLVESLFGAEYNAGCWALRVVTDRKTVSSTQVDSVLYVQLELNGMVRLGKNPLEALKTNIPGYRKTNEIY
jgi:LPS-assembly protein